MDWSHWDLTLPKVGTHDLLKDDILNPYEVNPIPSDYGVKKDSEET